MLTKKLNVNAKTVIDFNRERSTPHEQDFRKEFTCPEESQRYSGALEQLVFNKLSNHKLTPNIIEFGSGTGAPVISALLNSGFLGTVYGYEINSSAADTAETSINAYGLNKQYIIHNSSFFETSRIPHADYLIANPPYIPCHDSKLLTLPGLCGGAEGNEVSKKLLSYNYENIFLEISSYSNPVDLVEHARNLGYTLSDFQTTQMPFGIYSRQDIVWQKLAVMKKSRKAFFTNNCYLVGSAFFTKTPIIQPDLTTEFLACMTAFG